MEEYSSGKVPIQCPHLLRSERSIVFGCRSPV